MPERVGFGLRESYSFKRFESGRRSFVSGVFDNVEGAEKAVGSIERRGVPRDQITVLVSEEGRRRHLGGDRKLEIEKGTKAAEGFAAGSAIGGTVGAVVAAIVAAGSSIAIPPLGLVVAGPLAAALAGAGAGGVTGGLVGILIGAGMPEYEAKYYEERLKQGGIVVGAEARSEEEADQLEGELKDAGAEKVKQS
jgi:hypothetical protein